MQRGRRTFRCGGRACSDQVTQINIGKNTRPDIGILRHIRLKHLNGF